MGQIVILNSSDPTSQCKEDPGTSPAHVCALRPGPALTLCTLETSSQVGRSCATQALSHSTWSCPVSLQPLFVCSQIGFGGAGKQSISCFALTGLGSLVIAKHRSLHSPCHREGFVFLYISDPKSPRAHEKGKELRDSALEKRCQRELAGAGAGLCILRWCAAVGWAFPGTPQAEPCQCFCLERAGEKLRILAVGVAGGQVPGVDPSSGPSAAGAAGDKSCWWPGAPDKNQRGLMPPWRMGVCQRPGTQGRGVEGSGVSAGAGGGQAWCVSAALHCMFAWLQ